jgi:hypothetical protein
MQVCDQFKTLPSYISLIFGQLLPSQKFLGQNNPYSCHFTQKNVVLKLTAELLFRIYTGCFKKELYSGIPNVTLWQVLRKRLYLKVYKLCIVQGIVEVTLNCNYLR